VPKQRDDTTYMGATYLDNYNNLSQKSIETMENFKVVRPDYYYTMIKGLVSEGKRGRIYKHWKIISDKEYDELPYPKEYGLDFGFSNDPTSLVEIKRHNQNIYVKELIYETGMLNSHIADRMRTLGVNGLIRADSAEPKSIEELKQRGFNVVPADKGPDSIEYGVNYLNQHNVYYTQSSNNIALETQNYTYALDKEKNPTNTPIDSWNHAMDAIRYGCVTKKTNLVVL
jgi:phage terminase large subunit